MNNKPKYNFFKNSFYAIEGLIQALKSETSFKIELFLAVFLVPFIIYVDLSLVYKLIMFMTLMGVLLAETINSAIERVVDLVTLEHHPMAGRAKDVGSTIVFLSIGLFIVTWGLIIMDKFL